MAGKQLTAQELKKMTGGVALTKAIDANEDNVGSTGGGEEAPPGIKNGRCRISSFSTWQSDSGWTVPGVAAVVTHPPEHAGSMAYPKMFGFRADDFKDDDKAEKVVGNAIEFMAGLGVDEEGIAEVKSAGKNFFAKFVEIVEGQRGTEVKFSSRVEKSKDPKYDDRTSFRAWGAVESSDPEPESSTSGEPVPSEEPEAEGNDLPEVGEQWKWIPDGGEEATFTITAVNVDDKTVDLSGDDDTTHEGIDMYTLTEFVSEA